MNQQKFNENLERRIDLTRSVLSRKRDEYASGDDRMHNFVRAADMLGCSPERALIGMLSKHLVSILDIVDLIEKKRKVPEVETVEEKCGDAINYLILLEAMVKERIELWMLT